MGSSYGRSSRGIVLRFIVSATGWEAMKWKTMARILPAPAPDSVDLLSGSERTPLILVGFMLQPKRVRIILALLLGPPTESQGARK